MIFGNIFHIPHIIYKMNKFCRNEEKYSQNEKYSLLRNIAVKANKMGRVKVHVSGSENLPKEDGYLICPNHQGYYDTLAIIEAHERPFGIVIKKEYAGIILVKQVIKLVRGIAIDRSDIKASMEVIKKVNQELKNGYNFLIFPEGTRSHEGNKLLEMKAGAFKSATMSGASIVPVAITECYKPFDEKGLKKVDVSVNFLPAIDSDEYKNMKTVEIAAMVKDRIQEYIDKKTK